MSGLLSWDSLPPLRRNSFVRPLPVRVAASLRPRATSSKSCSVLVVSHHLDGLLRTELAGLLHPASDPGVRRVSESFVPAASRLDARDSSPLRESHPSKDSPRLQPFHVAVVVAFLPLSAPSVGSSSRGTAGSSEDASDASASKGLPDCTFPHARRTEVRRFRGPHAEA